MDSQLLEAALCQVDLVEGMTAASSRRPIDMRFYRLVGGDIRVTVRWRVDVVEYSWDLPIGDLDRVLTEIAQGRSEIQDG